MSWWQLPVEFRLPCRVDWWIVEEIRRQPCTLVYDMLFMEWLTIYQPVSKLFAGKQWTFSLLTSRCMRIKNLQSWCFQKQQEECLEHVQSFNYCEETEAIYSQCVFSVPGDKQNRNTPSVLSVPSLFSPFILLPHTSCHAFVPQSLTHNYQQPSFPFCLLSSFRTSLHPSYPTPLETFICSEQFPYFMPCQPQVWAEGN